MKQRNLTAVLIIFLFLMSGLAFVHVSAGPNDREPVPLPIWRDEIVAPGVGFWDLDAPALALDPAGNPHLVYGYNQLFHTWYDGASWQNETIDASSASRRGSVLAIDPTGTIIIADVMNEQLYARTKAVGGSWQTTRVPLPQGTRATSLTLALDSTGEPHIVAGPDYYYQQSYFIHAWHRSAGWEVEKVEAGHSVNGPFALAFDNQDRVFILYEGYDAQSGSSDLWLARQANGSWDYEKVAPSCVTVGKALVVDAQDKVHIVFSNHCDGQLTYMLKTENGWQTVPVSDSGYYPGLALDSIGRPHIVYNADEGQIYAILNGDSWEETLVQPGEYAGWYNTLVLDDKGAAHIVSYKDDLYYATNRGGPWQISTAVRQKNVGRQNALVIDSNDVAHSFYHEAETEKLYWASRNEEGWAAEQVAHVPAEGLEVAAVLDSQDRPTVAYVDASQDNLWVGSRQAGKWMFEPIGPGHEQLALAVGGDDRPQLLIVQNGMLNYWTKDGDDWIGETVSEAGLWYWKAYLAVDSQDRPHALYSNGEGSFYAIRQSPAQWVVEPLPFETVQGLVLDQQNQPHILYSEIRYESQGRYPIEIDSLWYAEREGSGWLAEYLWEEDYWSPEADLVVDAKKQIHVAFSSSYWGTYYLLRDESGAWQWADKNWHNEGNIRLAIGQAGQPRLLIHDQNSLILSSREIVWLDQFSLMPVIGGKPD